MSVKDSTGRLHCPKCNARLAIPSNNRSPYIRCGVCNVLFQTEVEPSEVMEDRMPYPSSQAGQKYSGAMHAGGTQPVGNQSAAEQRMANQPQRPSPEFNWSRPGRAPRWSIGPLALVALCFFGFLVFSLVNWADSSSSRRGRRSSRITYRSYDSTSQSSLQHKIETWKQKGYPRKELDLSAKDQIGKIKSGVDSVIIDERNLTTLELKQLERTTSIRKIKYSNVSLNNEDLGWVQNKKLYELDLNHSKWPVDQLKISPANLPYLIKLDLSYSSAVDETIWRLHHCRYLESINLRNTGVTDQSIRFLLLHHNVKTLDLCKTQVTGSGLVTLRNASLRVLKVSPGVLDTKQRKLIRANNPQIRIIISI